MMRIPLIKPNPAKLSESLSHLRDMEQRAIFSNFGPLNTRFENNITEQLFDGVGACLTVCNATIGLMIAMREAIERQPKSRRRYALMPSFTFAAAAQAAHWNRLTPLYCDINPTDWSADPDSERRLLAQYGHDIAVVVPYATFGYDIDLLRYENIQQSYGIPVIVDAAASLGTISAAGHGFGTGFSGAVVFSMHVTKSFSTSEGGLIYSGNPDLIRTFRSMSNFGFGEPRNATIAGLNGKMSEVAALLADRRLEDFDAVMQRRSQLMTLYRAGLPELTFQPLTSQQQAHQFIPVLLPRDLALFRTMVQYEMTQHGVATANYFSPHVAEQQFFRGNPSICPLPVTDDIASRIMTLPLFDTMTDDEVNHVTASLTTTLTAVQKLKGPSVQPHIAAQKARSAQSSHA